MFMFLKFRQEMKRYIKHSSLQKYFGGNTYSVNLADHNVQTYNLHVYIYIPHIFDM